MFHCQMNVFPVAGGWLVRSFVQRADSFALYIQLMVRWYSYDCLHIVL